jgi:HEAT repeat protein
VVRYQALYALAESDLPDKAKIFIGMLQNADEKSVLRKDVARVLGVLQEQTALEPLMAALSDASLEVQDEAAEALGNL